MAIRSKIQIIFIRTIYVLIDIVLIISSFFLASFIRQSTLPFQVSFENLFLDRSHSFNFVFFFWGLAVLFFNQINGLYQTRREQLESIEVWGVIKSIMLSAFFAVVLAYILKIQDFPRSIFALSVVLLSIFLSLWRVLKKFLVEYLVAQGYNNFNAVIIGAGRVGMLLQDEIRKRPGLGIKVVGFLDDFKTNQDVPSHCRVIGKIEDFTKIAQREFINYAFMTIHDDTKRFVQFLEDAKESGVAVRVIPQGFDLMGREVHRYNIGIIPVIGYFDMENAHQQFSKRIFDVIFSWAGLILLSPLFLIIMLGIRLDSPGPVFYLSRRFGRRGKIFYMLKFRSMVAGADKILKDLKGKNEVDGPIFKIKKDPRVTRSGAFLRKFSLDELPQIINVIAGDMSLVGPRPLPIDQIEREDLRQLKRLDIRPGITGLWQVRGRSDLTFQRLVRWDIWYINNWSFWLDMYIMVQTIPVVFKGRGAY